MIAPARVLISVRSQFACRAVLDAGEDLAQAFGIPMSGLRTEDVTLTEICGLPEIFLPTGLRRGATGSAHRVMSAALTVETKHVRAELKRISMRRSAEIGLSTNVGHHDEAVAAAAGPGDLIVTSVDLSEARLGSAIASMARHCPPGGGVLFVSETRPSRSGILVAIAGAEDERTADAANRLAAALHATALLVIVGEEDRDPPLRGPRPGVAKAVALEPGRRLSASMIHADAVRLIVVPASLIDRLELAPPESLMHRYRSSVLVLDDRPDGDR